MKFGVVIFPGSNCDRDMQWALQHDLSQEVKMLWHKDSDLQGLGTEDCVVLPGGFSYGDYLRCGAIASHSPIMQAIKRHADDGGKVLGVCNGFQILCETGLLPGALLANDNQKFVCKNTYITAPNDSSPINTSLKDIPLSIPIAHGEGRYYADAITLEQLENNDQIIFRYTDVEGNADHLYNPNGSLNNIAGVCNSSRNVYGMMPHPERATNVPLGNQDGLVILKNLLN